MLKPGSYFASYEWVATKDYNPSNPDHVRIMDEINYGNGLPVNDLPAMHILLSFVGPHARLHPMYRSAKSNLCFKCWPCCLLQEMRTYKEAEAAGQHVGFELVTSIDIATASPVAGPWCACFLAHSPILSWAQAC